MKNEKLRTGFTRTPFLKFALQTLNYYLNLL